MGFAIQANFLIDINDFTEIMICCVIRIRVCVIALESPSTFSSTRPLAITERYFRLELVLLCLTCFSFQPKEILIDHEKTPISGTVWFG